MEAADFLPVFDGPFTAPPAGAFLFGAIPREFVVDAGSVEARIEIRNSRRRERSNGEVQPADSSEVRLPHPGTRAVPKYLPIAKDPPRHAKQQLE